MKIYLATIANSNVLRTEIELAVVGDADSCTKCGQGIALNIDARTQRTHLAGKELGAWLYANADGSFYQALKEEINKRE